MFWGILFLFFAYMLVVSVFGLVSAIVNAGFLISFIILGGTYLLWNYGFWGVMLGLLIFIGLIFLLDKTLSK